MQTDFRKYENGIQGLLGLNIPLYFCTVTLLFGFPYNYYYCQLQWRHSFKGEKLWQKYKRKCLSRQVCLNMLLKGKRETKKKKEIQQNTELLSCGIRFLCIYFHFDMQMKAEISTVACIMEGHKYIYLLRFLHFTFFCLCACKTSNL